MDQALDMLMNQKANNQTSALSAISRHRLHHPSRFGISASPRSAWFAMCPDCAHTVPI